MAALSTSELLEREEALLAPYAMRPSQSRGRQYPEPNDPFRSPYQRDRDRIVHTTAFRRLEYKTQVFVNHEGDYYRTRLTHTIEVAEVARTVARALGANADLAEAISLAHDLGHPPFGHAGEHALQGLMEQHGGFEHNGQALRILTHLEERFPGFRGLNLSWEVLEGIAKHSTRWDTADARDYEPELQPTLEAQICSFADEIAYNSHDLDDGLRAGLLDFGDLQQVALWREAMEACAGFGRAVGIDVLRHQASRFVVEAQMADLVATTRQGLAKRSVQSAAAVRAAGELLVGYSPAMGARDAELKEFLYQHLYRHHGVVRTQQKARRVVSDLFRAYLDCPEQLAPPIRTRMDDESPARVICDYIAGMTDRFALDEHSKLFDPLARV